MSVAQHRRLERLNPEPVCVRGKLGGAHGQICPRRLDERHRPHRAADDPAQRVTAPAAEHLEDLVDRIERRCGHRRDQLAVLAKRARADRQLVFAAGAIELDVPVAAGPELERIDALAPHSEARDFGVEPCTEISARRAREPGCGSFEPERFDPETARGDTDPCQGLGCSLQVARWISHGR